jgi:tripartite-type tricarboxylate transporter receptor subunit TctC
VFGGAIRLLGSMSLAVAILFGDAAVASPSNYPTRAIKLIVPLEAGALVDNFARAVAKGLSKRLGQPVVVIDRPGASEALGVESVARSIPDGYTLLTTTQTGVVLDMAMRKDLPYDSRRDLAPVSLLFSAPLWLVTNPAVPVHSVSDLVALAKTEPGKLTYASIGVGSTLHLAGELFKLREGVDILLVPFKGSSSALLDLLAGRVDMMFSGGGSALPQIRAGKLRVLATTGRARSSEMPNVPTMMEAGVPNYNVATWLGFFAPVGTPQDIVDQLNREVGAVLQDSAVKQVAADDSLDVTPSTPAELADRIRSEIPYWTDLMGKMHIQ